MEQQLQITFRGIPHSDAIDAYIRERAAKLETVSTRITGCHVAVEAPHPTENLTPARATSGAQSRLLGGPFPVVPLRSTTG